MSVYGEYTLRLLNTLRFRISYMRLLAIAPHNSLSLRQCSATAASMYEIYGSLAEFCKRSVYFFETVDLLYLFFGWCCFLIHYLCGDYLISSASPQPGRPLGAAAEGREPPPGCGGATKMIRKMREEELIVYIYLKSSDKYRKYLNLTSYSYTQKKEQSPDILTQQISVDSDCANDGCVALFEHPWVRVCKSNHR